MEKMLLPGRGDLTIEGLEFRTLPAALVEWFSQCEMRHTADHGPPTQVRLRICNAQRRPRHTHWSPPCLERKEGTQDGGRPGGSGLREGAVWLVVASQSDGAVPLGRLQVNENGG